MAESYESLKCVKIGEEIFSLVEVPASGTVVMQKQKKLLMSPVDLHALMADLGWVTKFGRVAYHMLDGYTDLQLKTNRILSDVTKLCDSKSAGTMTWFKMASGCILGELQLAYHFLFEGLGEMAAVTLTGMTEEAKDMSEAAEQLYNNFDEEYERVKEAQKETITTRNSEQDRKKELEKKTTQFEDDIAKTAQERENAEKDFMPYEERFEGPEAKKAHEEELKRLNEFRNKTLQDIAELTKRMENCKEGAELAGEAIGALCGANTGLENLSEVIEKAACFWKQMQKYCDELTKEKIPGLIDTALKMPEEKRLAAWTSPLFKGHAVSCLVKWAALHEICSIYTYQLQKTQKDQKARRKAKFDEELDKLKAIEMSLTAKEASVDEDLDFLRAIEMSYAAGNGASVKKL